MNGARIWIIWATVTLASFFAIELTGPTLTHVTTSWMAREPIAAAVVLTFCAWLLVHFARHWWRKRKGR